MIYLILSAAFKEDNNGERSYFPLLKIGYTEDNKKDRRFLQYKLHNPTCQVLFEIPEATEDHEKRVQYRFKELLFKDYGREWFKYDKEIIEFFKNIKSLEDIESNLPKGNSDNNKFLKYKNEVKNILKYVSNIPKGKEFHNLCEEIFDILGDKIVDKDYTMNYFRLRFGEKRVMDYEKVIKSKETGIYCENFEINRRVSEFLSEYSSRSTYFDKMRLLCESGLSQDILDIVLAQIPDKDDIKSHFLALPKDRLRALGYNKTKISRELGITMFSPELLMDEIYYEFKEGERYTLINIKNKLSSIYSSINYQSTPKATDIERWFEIKSVVLYEKNEDGSRKQLRGYELLRSKEKELRQELKLVQ